MTLNTILDELMKYLPLLYPVIRHSARIDDHSPDRPDQKGKDPWSKVDVGNHCNFC